MSDLVVFAGPTCHDGEPATRLAALGARVLPPVAQGDVARLVALPEDERPRAIGIIDGVYERVPAVWHKEILWALSEGIAVVGAASMGALRAAELAPFGMTGVGRVYEAARDGVLVDDDEVAVAHLGPEDGHRPVSEAMVDIRATLDAATAEGVIDAATNQAVVAAAKRLHYSERRWPLLLHHDPTERLRAWLPTGRVGVKAADAVALLNLLPHVPPPTTAFHLEQTEQWRSARPAPGTGGLDPRTLDRLVEGLRRDGVYDDLERAATLRLVAVRHAAALRPHGTALAEWVERVRARIGAADLAGLGPRALAAFAADQACLVTACAHGTAEIHAALLDTLRVRGEYARRVAEARRPPDRARAGGDEKEDTP
ncbi:MAG TPA: TfuA-like protein [Thermomonospora sp.]|nr:TfuA-like protein [Thermomonospora sp.]